MGMKIPRRKENYNTLKPVYHKEIRSDEGH